MKIFGKPYWVTKATHRIKNVLPKTLFGRSLLIIVTPLILMQAISTFVFFDRHWDTMTRRLAHTLAGDIALIVDSLTPLPEQIRLNQIIVKADELDKPELIGILLLINILYPFVGITFLLSNTFKAAFK